MTDQQRQDFRQVYNQLRLALVDPGNTIAGVTKLYAPIDKWTFSYDDLMLLPDTPTIARYRQTRETSMWFQVAGAVH